MGSVRFAATLAVVVVITAACGQSQSSDTTLPPLRSIAEYPAVPVDAGAPPVVEWTDYSGNVRSVIDRMADTRDCMALERELTLVTADSTLALNRTGHTNAKLMQYIRTKLNAAGCTIR